MRLKDKFKDIVIVFFLCYWKRRIRVITRFVFIVVEFRFTDDDGYIRKIVQNLILFYLNMTYQNSIIIGLVPQGENKSDYTLPRHQSNEQFLKVYYVVFCWPLLVYLSFFQFLFCLPRNCQTDEFDYTVGKNVMFYIV